MATDMPTSLPNSARLASSEIRQALILPKTLTRDLRIAAAMQEKGISEIAAEFLADGVARVLAKR
ncbi:MAG: hypothetical protein ABSB49_20385 [Polyangia bacterium]